MGAYPEYCVFYGFDLAHCRLGTTEIVIELQRRHNRLPRCPFYIHSGHQSLDIQEHGTISSKCTQLEAVYCIDLYNFQDRLALLCLQITKCSLYGHTEE